MTVPVPGQLTYSYDEDGVTTVFAYPLRFLDASELVVIREVGGVQTALVLNTDYTVAGAGSPSGGSITRDVATDGGRIIITRSTVWKQTVDLQDNARNPADAVEQQLDRLAMAGQDTRHQLEAKADTDDLADVALSGDYDDLLNKPTLGTMAAEDAGDYTKTGDLGGLATKDKVSVSDIDATGTASASTFLRGDGSWAPGGGGGGDVFGPGSAVDGVIALFDGTTGKLLKAGSAPFSGSYDDLTDKPSIPSGTVTSVGLSAPTGFSVSGGPVTGSGTLTFTYASGYEGFTTTLKNKLDGIEAGADVTDATNVAAAGAVMDGNFSANGMMARTASGTYASRTVTAGTGITVTNGNGASGNPTVALSSGAQASLALADTAAQLAVEDQSLTGGARVTSKDLGTISSGTVTPDPGDRPLQHYTNGGAHTLAPGSNTGSYLLDITNNGSAGAITTSGWTKVSGDAFTTTNGHKFRCHCSIGEAGSYLVVGALQ